MQKRKKKKFKEYEFEEVQLFYFLSITILLSCKFNRKVYVFSKFIFQEMYGLDVLNCIAGIIIIYILYAKLLQKIWILYMEKIL